MRNVVRYTLASVTLFAAGAAHADWQYTRWGMSEQEVLAASKDVSEQTKRPQDRGKNLWLLAAPYSGGGYDFSAEFGFDKGSRKLTSVLLTLEDKGGDRCYSLQTDLMAKYGAPETDEKSSMIQSSTWRDAKGGNLVEWVKFGADASCSVSYDALSNAERNGL